MGDAQRCERHFQMLRAGYGYGSVHAHTETHISYLEASILNSRKQQSTKMLALRCRKTVATFVKADTVTGTYGTYPHGTPKYGYRL